MRNYSELIKENYELKRNIKLKDLVIKDLKSKLLMIKESSYKI